jgi:uncharacterized protein (TIGR03067 family)
MRTVMLMGLAAALLVGAGTTRSEEKDKPKFDAAKLVGTWKFVSGEKEGTKSAEEALKGKVEITKDVIKIIASEDLVFVMKYKLDTDAKPVGITIEGTEGPVKDQTIKGIIELDGDTLKLAYGLPGEPAAKEFKTKEGSKTQSFVMKREKKKE